MVSDSHGFRGPDAPDSAAENNNGNNNNNHNNIK